MSKWNGKIRDGEKGGNQVRVIDGAIQVRLASGSSGGGGDSDGINFVAAETAIGTWVGGATLYRKCIQIPAGPAATTLNTAHGITGLLSVPRMWGFLTRISTNDHVPLPYLHQAALTTGISLSVSGANVQLISGVNYSGFTGYVILEYTRT